MTGDKQETAVNIGMYVVNVHVSMGVDVWHCLVCMYVYLHREFLHLALVGCV